MMNLVKFDMLICCCQVLSQLLRKAKQKNLVIPYAKQAGSEQGTYEGATVSSSFSCRVTSFANIILAVVN